MRSSHQFLALFVAAPISAATFQGLGDLPDGTFASRAQGVSAAGYVVVGQGTSASGQEACIWNPTSGLEGIGDLPGGAFQSFARAASADGAVVVGSGMPGTCCDTEAFRWTAVAGMIGLGDLPGGATKSSAEGVSADGTVVVGSGASTSGNEAFRWTSGEGMVGLGDLPGGSFSSTAMAVSADGTVIAGASNSGISQAFVWDAENGMQGLGVLPTYGGSTAYGISADGSVVVGASYVPGSLNFEAFRWDAANGMQGLGDLWGGDGETSSFAVDTTANGSIVVGQSALFHHRYAFIWDAVHGMRQLDLVLTHDYGLDLTGWTLYTATSISDDGSVIAGWGSRLPTGEMEGWVAMPEPSRAVYLGAGAGLLAALSAHRKRRGA